MSQKQSKSLRKFARAAGFTPEQTQKLKNVFKKIPVSLKSKALKEVGETLNIKTKGE